MILEYLSTLAIDKEQIMKVFFIGAIMILFYLFSIRPQRKKFKNQKNFIDTLEPGMLIVTIGGIYGKILSIEDQRVKINSEGSHMLIDKNAISVEATKSYLSRESKDTNEKTS